jgi:hypothetical protein
VIEPRTAALAEAARQAEAATPERDGSAAARDANSRDIRRFMAEQAEGTVLALRVQMKLSREAIAIFERTGEVRTPQMGGSLGPVRADLTFEMHGGPAGYIDALRRGLARREQLMPDIEANAAMLRTEAATYDDAAE